MARKKSVESTSQPAKPAAETPAKGEHTEKKPAGAGGLLGKLMSKAKAAPEKPSAKKKVKPVIQLEGEEAAVFDTFTSSDAILKVAKSSQEAAKARAAEIIKAHYLRMCVEGGYKPENPSVVSPNSKCNFQVKHVSKVKRTPAPNGEMLTVEEQLRALGFGDDVVEAITSKVIKERPNLGLKKFTDLAEGTFAAGTFTPSTPKQKAVAEKLMALVDEHLDDEEKALVLEQSIDTTVDESWKDLAVQLACKVGAGDVDAGVAALEKLYSVLSPQFVMAQMIFSGQLSDAMGKLASAPPPEKKTIKSGNGRYEAVCEGNDVSLYLVKPGEDEEPELLGTKKCTSPGHAEMSARKWFREPEALAEALAGFAGKK